jgi:hypothetical protein
MIDFLYPCSNVWNLICEPLEEIEDFEDLKDWGSLQENLQDNLEEEYE